MSDTLTPDEVALILRAARLGTSVQTLASAYRKQPNTIRGLLLQHGVEPSEWRRRHLLIPRRSPPPRRDP